MTAWRNETVTLMSDSGAGCGSVASVGCDLVESLPLVVAELHVCCVEVLLEVGD